MRRKSPRVERRRCIHLQPKPNFVLRQYAKIKGRVIVLLVSKDAVPHQPLLRGMGKWVAKFRLDLPLRHYAEQRTEKLPVWEPFRS